MLSIFHVLISFFKLLSRPLYWFVTGLLFSLALSTVITGAFTPIDKKAIASTQPVNSIPMIAWQNTQLPDWNQIAFGNLPGIKESGSFSASSDIQRQLGYDPSRSWMAGQTPDQYTKLGDFQDAFRLQEFNLQSIASIVDLDLKGINLSQFVPMSLQTLGSLVKAIPSLRKLPIKQVEPVLDLLNKELVSDVHPEQIIGQLLQQSPLVGDLEFANLPLDSYGLNAIPGLDITPIGSFENWQGVSIDGIPGLSDVPFSQFPNPANSVGADVGIVDIAFGSAEQQRSSTISGSDVEGFNVPCAQDCAHIELSGSAKVLGKQWISGKYQEVRGGHGVLASVNNGLEPTGRHPFGEAFKVVLWDTSESEGIINQALFFRICIRKAFVDLGCTPYFIGPVPWLSYREMSPIFLGSVDSTQSVGGSVSTLTGASSTSNTPFTSGKSNLSYLLPPHRGNCKKQYQGVVLDAFSSALSDIEGNYDSVGAYVCDKAGNCGRGLGTKQFMSYRSDVRSQILAKPGGKEFLSKIDSGAYIGGEEMMQYFPPSDQEALFEADVRTILNKASQQVDPSTGQPFSNLRLIERAAQIHFGGSNIPIDAVVSDVYGKLNVKTYGQQGATNYQQTLKYFGCS